MTPLSAYVCIMVGSVIYQSIKYGIVGRFDTYQLFDQAYWMGIAFILVAFGYVKVKS